MLCLELQSLFNDDYDEVIAVEPFFDSCVDQIKLSSGDSWKVTQEHMMQIFKSYDTFTDESIEFMKRVLEISGAGDATAHPPSIAQCLKVKKADRSDERSR